MKRNLQLAKLADFNIPSNGKKYQKTTNVYDFDEISFLKWFDDLETTFQDCKSLYMLNETYIDKILETRIVCLGNYSLVKACNITNPFWVLSKNLALLKIPHETKCECNQIPRNTRRIGDYHDEVHCKKNAKKEANEWFAKMTKKCNNVEGDILYLDSDSMFTTQTLIAKKVKGTKYAVNFDEFIINEMLKTKLEVIPQFGTILQLITDFTSSLKSVWFDYCGRFDGCTVCKPKFDIKQLFKSNRLTYKSILGFTFTIRDFKAGTFQSKRQRIMTWIQRCAQKYGYELKRIKTLYYNSMFFVLYNCIKK